MRLPGVIGGFLTLTGFMLLVLKPVYKVPTPAQSSGVEAVAPLHEYRPIPGWVGAASSLVGVALLVGSGLRRR